MGSTEAKIADGETGNKYRGFKPAIMMESSLMQFLGNESRVENVLGG